jgi:hypothetical protein
MALQGARAEMRELLLREARRGAADATEVDRRDQRLQRCHRSLAFRAEAEPGEVTLDRRLELRPAAGPVGVVQPQDEFTVLLPCK